ncbi:uncharacterized protein A1O9_02310 [Exophiala aquamarina CBS 119918]|uniref:D-isomer specific 2-hydroxyacid dehydrogenase NAD-binding domain-containing protein n=1 Tax=Exophiala aquamarina CBS 119918 TaxID=1182545 RepID=A0A072PKZ1_9EURO|nr:uncharacterized protein A1O9_02310 [Exophiala aquamarina CBS 119918]KEF60749.1 hypothetical protein A1O9_02310 [Exophiala aquamarina CBS 119918]
MVKLLYPTSHKLDISLVEGFSIELCPYNVKELFREVDLDAEILVTWFNSKDNLKDAATRLKKLRWVQSLSAGANDILAAGFGPEVILTSGSGLHDHTVAEHTLGLILNAARRFFEMRDYQMQGKWPGHLGGMQPDRPPGAFTSLCDANVLIWGFGNIARTLSPLLLALGARVRGIARQPGIRSGIEVFSDQKIEELLPETDVLLMMLPGSQGTKNVLSAQRLELLPKHAWVVNVGRGMALDEKALYEALHKGVIGGAALDVFVTEPLPEASPLWKAPNLILSPHAAGGRPRDPEGLIAHNVRQFQAGQKLKNVL